MPAILIMASYALRYAAGTLQTGAKILRKRVCSGADRRYLHSEEAILRIAASMQWWRDASFGTFIHMTMNGNWGYRASDGKWKSTERLVRMLIEIVSKGGNLLLNVGPMGDGSCPAESVERLKGIGASNR